VGTNTSIRGSGTGAEHAEWRTPAAVGAVLAVGGALVYGLLVFAYSQYYAELGVRPAEVGLQYGPGVGGSAGVAVLLVLVIVLGSLVPGLLGVRTRIGEEGAWPPWTRSLAWFSLCFVIIMSVATGWLVWIANNNGDKVKRGEPVEPIRIGFIVQFELMSFRADLATVAPAKRNPAPEIAALSERTDELLYLGRSEGIVVLYDAFRETIYHVPAAAVVVRTRNCETRLRDRLACSGPPGVRRRRIMRLLDKRGPSTDGSLAMELWQRNWRPPLRRLTTRLQRDGFIERATGRERWMLTQLGRDQLDKPPTH
jgi:hypothetical protein